MQAGEACKQAQGEAQLRAAENSLVWLQGPFGLEQHEMLPCILQTCRIFALKSLESTEVCCSCQC